MGRAADKHVPFVDQINGISNQRENKATYQSFCLPIQEAKVPQTPAKISRPINPNHDALKMSSKVNATYKELKPYTVLIKDATYPSLSLW
jgi:hypothetical protein